MRREDKCILRAVRTAGRQAALALRLGIRPACRRRRERGVAPRRALRAGERRAGVDAGGRPVGGELLGEAELAQFLARFGVFVRWDALGAGRERGEVGDGDGEVWGGGVVLDG